MGGNNKKKSSPEKQCDGYSICKKRCFASVGIHMMVQNASREGARRCKFVQFDAEIDYLSAL
jgi:hypothetical protein